MIGVRNACKLVPSQYKDTTFYFDGISDTVALTIDDGLSRGGMETSMVDDVRQLLAEYEAKATFFVCTKYLEGVDRAAVSLLRDGHEFGNHLGEDLQFVYHTLPKEQISAELASATAAIQALPGKPRVRWFRAPQGIMSSAMAEAVEEQNLHHALGDSYCDDWALENNVPFAVRTLVHQAVGGSIIILHMPERGFRQHTYEILQQLLAGLREKKLRCVTLSELEQQAIAADATPADFGGVGGSSPTMSPAKAAVGTVTEGSAPSAGTSPLGFASKPLW